MTRKKCFLTKRELGATISGSNFFVATEDCVRRANEHTIECTRWKNISLANWSCGSVRFSLYLRMQFICFGAFALQSGSVCIYITEYVCVFHEVCLRFFALKHIF